MKRIAIHSVPRSGSSWLGTIFDAHPNVIYKFQPLFSYAFKDRISAASSLEEIDTFFKELSISNDDFLNQTAAKKRALVPIFKKEALGAIVYKEVRYHHVLENLLEKDGTLKVVGLVRNPLSVISSWLKAPKEFRNEKGWKIEEEWEYAAKKNLGKPEEFNGYEKWKEVTALFESLKSQFPERFYLVNYEDLLLNKVEAVTKIFSFCNLQMHSQVLDFIRKSSLTDNADAYSVFKIKKRDNEWEKNLPQFIIDEIMKDKTFLEYNNRYHWV